MTGTGLVSSHLLSQPSSQLDTAVVLAAARHLNIKPETQIAHPLNVVAARQPSRPLHSTTNRFTPPDQPRLIPNPPTAKPNPQQNKPTMAAALPHPPPAPPAPGVPQFAVPCQALWGRRPAQPPHHDASHCHPVFFTDKLRRPPFSVLSGPHSSPVAHGYVYQDAPRGGKKAAGPRL